MNKENIEFKSDTMKKYVDETLNYYNKFAKEYTETWTDDFLNNYNFEVPSIFLSYIKPNSYILDLGCGTGRDSKFFKEKGYKVKSIDGSSEMCKIASNTLNEEVEQVNFLDIDYENIFDGVFACASLLHLQTDDLIEVLKKVSKSLKKDGVLYASFKNGAEERIKEGRFYNDMTEEKFTEILSKIKEFKIIKIWKTEQYKSHRSFINFIVRKEENHE